MAYIRESENQDGKKKYNVEIRTRKNIIRKTFEDRKTAELFAWYKEKLIKEMDNFELELKQMITLKDAMDVFMSQDFTHKNPKYIPDSKADYQQIIQFIPESTYLNEISKETLEEFIKNLSKCVLKKGGSKNKDSGIIKPISPKTMKRRLSFLSNLINTVNALTGSNISNPITHYMPFFIKKFEESL